MGLIVVVLGSIYTGVATPTEAAAIGVVSALALSLVFGSLTWENFTGALLGATRTSCMIAFILAGATFLTAAMGFTGIPRALAAWITSLDLSVAALLVALTILYVVLGCFLDGISIVVLTTGVIQPMIIAAGIDVIWYGIYLVIVVEIAQITPPVGFNLFVLQYFTGRDILYVARASLPFFFVLLASIVVLVAVPGDRDLPADADARPLAGKPGDRPLTLVPDPLAPGGIEGFGQRLRQGATTTEAATEAYLERIAALDPRLGAYQHVAVRRRRSPPPARSTGCSRPAPISGR